MKIILRNSDSLKVNDKMFSAAKKIATGHLTRMRTICTKHKSLPMYYVYIVAMNMVTSKILGEFSPEELSKFTGIGGGE